MQGNEKTVIEINGVKMEVDLRQATVVENYRVGSSVKVLIKEYSSYKMYPGMIVDFYMFKSTPAILLAYVETGYNPDIKFVTVTSETEGVEFAPISDFELTIDKESMVDALDRKIVKAETELLTAKQQKDFFLKSFSKAFEFKQGE
jgi:hypothetical protein